MDLFIVVVEDRHASVDAVPFTREQDAGRYARDHAGGDGTPEELTAAAVDDGWVLCIPYGTEGDLIRVIRRTLDPA